MIEKPNKLLQPMQKGGAAEGKTKPATKVRPCLLPPADFSDHEVFLRGLCGLRVSALSVILR